MAIEYVERERLISGNANVYGPRDGELSDVITLSRAELVPLGSIVARDLPYATRLVVRAPARAADFSGVVIIEPIHNVGEMTPAWFVTDGHITRHGHAWVGVTVSSGAHVGVDGAAAGGVSWLRRENPDRYGELHLEDGDPSDWPLLRGQESTSKGLLDVLTDSPFTGTSNDPRAFGAMIEEIYRTYAHSPDIITRIAESAKRDHRVTRVYATGASGTAVWWNAYIDGGHHDRSQAIDGYVLYVATPPLTRPSGAALVSVLSEAEALLVVAEGGDVPPDVDAPPFRQYELAGTGHRLSGADLVGVSDALESRTSSRAVARSAELIPFDRVTYPVINGIWRAMERCVTTGEPMPASEQIERDPTQDGGLVRDEHGNAVGGLRTPWVDVPNARYLARSPWNPLRAAIEPFKLDRMRRLYGDVETYRERFRHAVDRLVASGWVDPAESADMDPGDFPAAAAV